MNPQAGILVVFFETCANIVLNILNWVLSVFKLPYVSQMTDAIVWAVSMVNALNNTFPVYALFQCMLVLMLCNFYKYQIKLFMHTIWPMIPFIGSHISLPVMIHGQDNMDMPYYQSAREINVTPNRKGAGRTFYVYARRKTKKSPFKN